MLHGSAELPKSSAAPRDTAPSTEGNPSASGTQSRGKKLPAGLIVAHSAGKLAIPGYIN